MRFSLEEAPFAGRTGNGVIVAVVDSGIHAGHPHVGGVKAGVCIVPGLEKSDFTDRLGHGTAVAAAIREKAPAAELLAVKVFDRQLSTTADTLAVGIMWAADHGAHLINLSLGTANASRRQLLERTVEHATKRGSIVVSARESGETVWFPGSLPAVAGVLLDWECGRDELDARFDKAAATFRASGYPRPIPGVAPERNLSGISFAVANVTGFLARMLEGRREWGLREVVKEMRAMSPET